MLAARVVPTWAVAFSALRRSRRRSDYRSHRSSCSLPRIWPRGSRGGQCRNPRSDPRSLPHRVSPRRSRPDSHSHSPSQRTAVSSIAVRLRPNPYEASPGQEVKRSPPADSSGSFCLRSTARSLSRISTSLPCAGGKSGSSHRTSIEARSPPRARRAGAVCRCGLGAHSCPHAGLFKWVDVKRPLSPGSGKE